MRSQSEFVLAPHSLPDGPILLALIGAAGSGKSRVARAFPADWRLELDNFRWRATGSPGDQTATPIASVVFRELLDARLTRKLPVLADSTNSELDVRAYLLRRARHWGMTTVAIVFRVPVEECLARQETRTKAKQVPPDAVTRQAAGVPHYRPADRRGLRVRLLRRRTRSARPAAAARGHRRPRPARRGTAHLRRGRGRRVRLAPGARTRLRHRHVRRGRP